MVDIIQERRRLNEEIERTFIQVADHSRRILTFRQTERGASALELYENFFTEFSLLVILTSDLSQIKKSVSAVSAAEAWLGETGISQNATDTYILQRCYDGVKAFMEYKKALSETGVLSMPSR
jgi:hypothetical protein